MNRLLSIAAALAFVAVNAATAQPFIVSASPDSLTATGSTATFAVQVLADVSYTSTVYLSASVPSLSSAQVSVSPSLINSPYTDTAWVTVTLTGPKTGGTHAVIVSGANGPASAADTVYLTIPNRLAWTVYQPSTVGTHNDVVSRAGQFMLDRANGVGYFLGGDSLHTFDGATWSVEALPRGTTSYKGRPRGMTVDGNGTLWALMERAICKRTGSTWEIIDAPDTATGFTKEMLSAIYGTSSGNYSGICTTPDGSVWITGFGNVAASSTGRALWLMRYYNGSWSVLDADNSQCPAARSTVEMVMDNTGNLWMGGFGINPTKYDGTYWTAYPNLNKGPTQNAIPFGADRTGSVWFNGVEYTAEVNGDDYTFYYDDYYTHSGPHEVDSSYYGMEPRAIDVDADGDTWLGMTPYQRTRLYDGGLARFTDGNIYHYTIGNSGLPNNDIINLAVDDNKMVWIITTDGGLTILDGNAAPSSAYNGGGLSWVGSNGASTGANSAMRIVPNPTTTSSQLTLRVMSAGHVLVRVVNSIGQAAVLFDGQRPAGDLSVQIPVDRFAPGTYFIQYANNGVVETRPFVVAR